MSVHRPSHALIVAYLALLVALGGTGYAAATINGKDIRRGTVAGAKLKPDTLTGKQVREGALAKVPSAAQADHAATAGNADDAATLGNLGPSVFARAAQFKQAGPFTTNPSGPDRDFFYFPELDLLIRTPRAPNAPGGAGLVQVRHVDPTLPLWYSYRNGNGAGGGVYPYLSNSGINWLVDGPGGSDDFLDMTFHSVSNGVVIKLECVADINAVDGPVTCSALKFSP